MVSSVHRPFSGSPSSNLSLYNLIMLSKSCCSSRIDRSMNGSMTIDDLRDVVMMLFEGGVQNRGSGMGEKERGRR